MAIAHTFPNQARLKLVAALVVVLEGLFQKGLLMEKSLPLGSSHLQRTGVIQTQHGQAGSVKHM